MIGCWISNCYSVDKNLTNPSTKKRIIDSDSGSDVDEKENNISSSSFGSQELIKIETSLLKVSEAPKRLKVQGTSVESQAISKR
jgi:hypothetical protein